VTGRARRRAKGGPAGVRRRPRPIAFWLHQLFEYLLATGLVVLSVHIGHSGLLLLGGVIVGVLAVTGRGPLGVVRVCGSRLHATLDIGAGIFLVVAPLIGPLRPGAVGIVVVELSALAFLRMASLTRHPTGGAISAPVPAPAASSTPRPDAGPGSQAQSGSTLSAIHRLGRMTAAAQTRLPEARSTLESGARRIGGHAGRLQRAWRRATR